MADQVASILSWLRESAQLAFADAVPIIRLYAIPVIGLILWLVMSCISTASVIIIIWRYSRPPQPKSSNMKTSEVPGVSVLRPLKGVDENLKDNLASCFRLNYPKFELLFSVASDKDPAIEVVRELKEEFPNVDATMIIGDVNVGVNPKINNLVRSYAASKYEIIWILDSNVIVDKDSMGRSVDLLMLPRVGLVHHLPIGTRPVAFGSVVEGSFLNTAHAKMYVVINKVAVASCIVGKSNLFWKWTLNGVGGVHKFGRFMSEDNIIGNYIWNQRLRHMMTSDVAYQPLGKLSLEDYFTRRARWTRIRKYTVVGATLFEPFTESVVNAIFSAYSLNFFFGVPTVPYFFLHMALWFLVDLIISTVLSPDTRKHIPVFFCAWLVREITALPVYLYACAGSTVEWRGTLFRLKNDGTVEQAPDSMQLKSTGDPSSGEKKVARDDLNSHPLVTYTRTVRMLGLGFVAAVLFVVAYIYEMVAFPFILVWGDRGRLGRIDAYDEVPANGDGGSSISSDATSSSATPLPKTETTADASHPLWMRVAGMITGRNYSGRAFSLSDVWHSMFVAVGLVSSFRSRDTGMSPRPPPSTLAPSVDGAGSDGGQRVLRKRRTRGELVQ